MKNYIFVAVVMSFLAASFKGTVCTPLPTPSTISNVTELTSGNEKQFAQDHDATDNSLDCIMEAISVMVSGNEQTLSDSCKEMIKAAQDEEPATEQSNGDTNSDATDDVNTPPTPSNDLQAELEDLTSQLRGIDADYNVDGDDKELGMKRHEQDIDDVKRSDGDSVDSLDDNATEEENTNDKTNPFVTSLGDISDEFLVIPLKYLRKQMEASMFNNDVNTNAGGVSMNTGDVSENGDDVPNKVINKKEEEVSTAMEDNAAEDGEDAVTKAGDWADDTATEMDMEQLDALYQVQLDLKKLGQDMKYLKKKQQE
uniref:Uncharacterized protein n=1 Tax=Ciona savignyi TaxID=51511 RepID=H2YH87_CIOSA